MHSAPLTRRRRLRLIVALAAVAAVAGTVSVGGARQPAGAAEGEGLRGHPPAAAGPGPLRVGTFNIHRGKGRDGRVDLARTAETLRGLDVVGLNEVAAAGLDGQAGDLGELLLLGWLFAPTERRWGRNDFGNGLLSRYRVTRWKREPLPGSGGPPFRNTLTAELSWGKTQVRLLVTHIDPRRGGSRQLAEVIRRFQALERPAILLGDLNIGPEHPTMKDAISRFRWGDPLRDRQGEKRKRSIDWVLTRGFRTRDAGLRDLGASDHPAVWAELTLPSASHNDGGAAPAAGDANP